MNIFKDVHEQAKAMISGSNTASWRVLGLRIQEWSQVWRVDANMLNKQSRTAD